jgi:type VI secretion system secreted protein VgrG
LQSGACRAAAILGSFAMPIGQSDRSAKLFTPLGKDKLCLVEVATREALGRPFECEIHAVSEDSDIDFDALIGQPCHVEIDRGVSGKRVVHGVLAEGAWMRIENDLAHYHMVLRPWFWLLDKTSDCRIFHDKTVLQILRETFARRGFSDYRFATTHDYPELHYTVQYRETDFNFLSRLMEQHGLYYYFEHSKGAHVLVLCDGPASHPEAPDLAQVVFVSAGDPEHSMRSTTMQSWRLKRSLRSGRSALQDFNHLTPNAQMEGEAAANAGYAHGKMEIYDYPGQHAKQNEGVAYARVRLEAEQAGDKRREAAGYVVGAFAGAPLTLDRHPRQSENGKYLIVETQFRYGPQYYWSQPGGTQAAYHGDYDLLPFDTPFRTPLTTPKPRIASLQTALVVGEDGEEIDCDDHGRILVRFHWDREKGKSCRVRVSQVWAGQGWGGQIIPRIGMEVVVAYLEGDPDRPVVVGCVTDPVNHPPSYGLPGSKTRAVWKSKTDKGGGFNELSFEDKKDEEEVFLHAQRDFRIKVKRDIDGQIDRDVVLHVDRDIKAKADKEIFLEAGTLCTIKCGLSTITLDRAGTIKIDGVNIKLKAPSIELTAAQIAHKMG